MNMVRETINGLNGDARVGMLLYAFFWMGILSAGSIGFVVGINAGWIFALVPFGIFFGVCAFILLVATLVVVCDL